MRIGTRSVIFGAHQFLIHPLLVAIGWWINFGFPWDPRLWLAFFVHDLGYLGKPNMDGPEGETHPEWGAALMRRWFGDEWGDLVLLHSRYYAKRLGRPVSRLCHADKAVIVIEPSWLYLPRVWLSGELAEFMEVARRRVEAPPTPGDPLTEEERAAFRSGSALRWHRAIKSYMRRWIDAHRDGRPDTWTRARHSTGGDEQKRRELAEDLQAEAQNPEHDGMLRSLLAEAASALATGERPCATPRCANRSEAGVHHCGCYYAGRATGFIEGAADDTAPLATTGERAQGGEPATPADGGERDGATASEAWTQRVEDAVNWASVARDGTPPDHLGVLLTEINRLRMRRRRLRTVTNLIAERGEYRAEASPEPTEPRPTPAHDGGAEPVSDAYELRGEPVAWMVEPVDDDGRVIDRLAHFPRFVPASEGRPGHGEGFRVTPLYRPATPATEEPEVEAPEPRDGREKCPTCYGPWPELRIVLHRIAVGIDAVLENFDLSGRVRPFLVAHRDAAREVLRGAATPPAPDGGVQERQTREAVLARIREACRCDDYYRRIGREDPQCQAHVIEDYVEQVFATPATGERKESVVETRQANKLYAQLCRVLADVTLCIDALEGRDGADVATELAVARSRLEDAAREFLASVAPNEPEPNGQGEPSDIAQYMASRLIENAQAPGGPLARPELAASEPRSTPTPNGGGR